MNFLTWNNPGNIVLLGKKGNLLLEILCASVICTVCICVLGMYVYALADLAY